MTYGIRPENWPAFQSELQKRGIMDALRVRRVARGSYWSVILFDQIATALTHR